jgi:hypothetical protein
VPPYRAVTSKAQSRKLFALAGQGKISMSEAKGKTKAANWKRLPAKKSKKSASHVLYGKK